MKVGTTILWVVLFNQPTVEQTYGQEKPDNRYPLQFYFEDSAHVFWTAYPNPFSPPTIRDTSKGMNCGAFTFYCDISETVTVAILGEKDSTVYESAVDSRSFPDFSLCFWLAGPRVDLHSLPVHYIRGESGKHFKLLLAVQGRRKCVREFGIYLPKDWYCWIDDIKQKK